MMQEYFGIEISDSIHMALPLEDIEAMENFQQQNLCPIPGMPNYWFGVANQRGSLLWILDTELFFNLESSRELGSQKLTAVILKRRVQETQRRVALVVKKLEGVVDLAKSQLEPVPGTWEPRLQKLGQVMAIKQGSSFIILDSEAFFQELQQKSFVLNPVEVI